MNLKKKYPKAWADFEEWYRDTDGRIIDLPAWHVFGHLDFSCQLGVYLKYVWENEFEEVNVSNLEDTKDAIEQAFKIREGQL